MENIIKQKLIERGFSEKTLLNNRGLIGACIEETKEQLTISVVSQQRELCCPNPECKSKNIKHKKNYDYCTDCRRMFNGQHCG